MFRRYNYSCNYKYILWTIIYKSIDYCIKQTALNSLKGGVEYDSSEMPPRRACCLATFLRQMPSAKFFFLVCCLSFAFSVVWILVNRSENPLVTERLSQKALANCGPNTTYFPKDLKYVLVWAKTSFSPFIFFCPHQRAADQHIISFYKKCSAINCYVTNNRSFFGGNMTKFDAILFNGRNLNRYDLPNNRSRHQKYIFANVEPAESFPVCHDTYDGFFNWTSTYRLDSDISYPYISIRDNNGKIVGPKPKMNWIENMDEVKDKFIDRLVNKSRAAAWFVSNCLTRSYRMNFVTKLQAALAKYRYTVDIYGRCGNLKCDKEKPSICNELLRRDYYFYMAMENSFNEDYVTEKLLTALTNDVVPIVYGGADYSRFLPPGSYIDARKYEPKKLAALMNELIHSPRAYINYFKWKNHYKYYDPFSSYTICDICEALNNKSMVEKVSVYKHFREWWKPDYKYDGRC